MYIWKKIHFEATMKMEDRENPICFRQRKNQQEIYYTIHARTHTTQMIAPWLQPQILTKFPPPGHLNEPLLVYFILLWKKQVFVIRIYIQKKHKINAEITCWILRKPSQKIKPDLPFTIHCSCMDLKYLCLLSENGRPNSTWE
jgi:hypothetical protein